MHGWSPGMGWGAMICGGALGLLVLAALVVVIVLLFTRSATGRGEAGSGPTAKSPMDILKERYARGEIDEQEYEAMREKLRS